MNPCVQQREKSFSLNVHVVCTTLRALPLFFIYFTSSVNSVKIFFICYLTALLHLYLFVYCYANYKEMNINRKILGNCFWERLLLNILTAFAFYNLKKVRFTYLKTFSGGTIRFSIYLILKFHYNTQLLTMSPSIFSNLLSTRGHI